MMTVLLIFSYGLRPSIIDAHDIKREQHKHTTCECQSKHLHSTAQILMLQAKEEF